MVSEPCWPANPSRLFLTIILLQLPPLLLHLLLLVPLLRCLLRLCLRLVCCSLCLLAVVLIAFFFAASCSGFPAGECGKLTRISGTFLQTASATGR